MAATFTEVTLEDMEKFLKRAYRPLRPKKGEDRGEVYYDLNLSDNKIFIRIWTSIRPHSGQGAGVGQDAIRVTMVTKGGKPLVKKGKIVKRTKNWRHNVQDRVDGLLEDYEAKTGYWKNRQQERDEAPAEAKPAEPTPPPETEPGQHHEGAFTKLRNDAWGAKIFGQASAGDTATLATKGGKRLNVTLVEKSWSGKDRFSGKYVEVWSFEANGGRRYATDADTGEMVDLTPILVAERKAAV